MSYHTDRDGKSKTASGVANQNYPEQHEIIEDDIHFGSLLQDEIAERAYLLWHKRGRPEGTAELDWFEAERELQAAQNSRNAIASTSETGSVQR